MDFCPGHNFQSIEASNFKFTHRYITIRRIAVYKNCNSIPLIIPPQTMFGGLGYSTGVTLSVRHKKLILAITSKVLTHYQTNFRLVQIETVCRRQF